MGLLFAQQFARLPVEEMDLGAGSAGDRLVFVLGRVLSVVDPLLDYESSLLTHGNELRHLGTIAVRWPQP
jgi:hypothetical protein